MTKARDLADFVSAGNPLADGTIDVADINGITATTAELNYTDGVTSNIQTQLDAKVDLAGDTMTGDLSFGDNDKAIFGAGSDLQIYHDGSHSLIQDNGTGDLYIRASDNLRIQQDNGAGGWQNAINTNLTGASGYVDLNHGGSVKLATTATGIDVTGTVAADTLNVQGASSTVTGLSFLANTSGVNKAIDFQNTSGLKRVGFEFDNSIAQFSIVDRDGNKMFTVDEPTGDISFYEDTGTTPKFFWDASAESLGIGTSSPLSKLDVNTSSSPLSISNGTTAIGQLSYASSSSPNRALTLLGLDGIRFNNSTSEAMRIDSSGDVMVGKTTSDNTTQGIKLDSSGYASFTIPNDYPIIANRLSSDGNIAVFRKDGSTVGSIFSNNSQYLGIGSTDVGLLFLGAADDIRPWNSSTNAARDAAIDLGNSDARFKDLYLSGSISDGTNSATVADIVAGGGAEVWANYNAQTNPVTIRGSSNVSSITDNGTGNQTVNFTNAMADANYSVVEGGTRDGGVANAYKNMTDSLAAGSVRVQTGVQNVNSAADHLIVCIAVFR